MALFFWRAMILVVVVGDHVSFNKLLAGKKYPKAGMKEKYMVMNLWVFGRQYEIYPPVFGYDTRVLWCFLPGASCDDLQASSHRNISD